MSREERTALSQRVRGEPDDLHLRVQLIGAYYRDHDATSQTRRAEQLSWLIAEHPEVQLSSFAAIDGGAHPEAYAVGKQAWLTALSERPGQADVLMNAAKYLHFVDPLEAEPLYRRGALLEPKRAAWHDALGHLWLGVARAADSELERQHGAEQALAAFELAHARESSEFGRFGTLIDIATAAADAKRWQQAELVAEQVLSATPRFARTFQHGNAVHHANIVLGKAALARGELAQAAERLAAAGATSGSPQLNAFGPDLSLASALLSRGERAAVSAYLEACLRFWRGHEAQVQAWQSAIAEHEDPFRA